MSKKYHFRAGRTKDMEDIICARRDFLGYYDDVVDQDEFGWE